MTFLGSLVRRVERHTSGLGLDQEWQVELGTWRRASGRVDIGQSGCSERRLNRTRRVGSDEIECRFRMVRRFGRHELPAARKSAFAAVVRVRRGKALALFAAIRGFLGELSAAKAIERLQKQEDCDDANRNVNATAHSSLRVADRICIGQIARARRVKARFAWEFSRLNTRSEYHASSCNGRPR